MIDASPLAIVEQHHRGAFSFRLKATASGTLFLVLPRRDPAQPRFWCVVVVRCAPNGLVDSAEWPWIGRRGLRREELAETMEAIRSDVNIWLAEPSQQQLRSWFLTALPVEADTSASAGAPTGRAVDRPGSSTAIEATMP